MILKRLEVEGYRSITRLLSLYVEPNVTIMLGPNDHGKTNLLNALTHLNSDNAFDADIDLSWDRVNEPSDFPYVMFEFELNDEERNTLLESENEIRSKESTPTTTTTEVTPAAATATSEIAELSTPSPDDTLSENTDESGQVDPIKPSEIPETIQLERRGLEGELEWLGCDGFHNEVIDSFITENLPRVELVEPWTKLTDSVTQEDNDAGTNEFMRGIFYYAGLDPNNCTHLFTQDDATEMELDKASKTLNSTLKKSWSQGQNLEFVVNHNSKLEAIELKIKDPSVESRRVRASRRSSGFTHYFTLKTILHARQNEHPAKSYIILFDEPGIYLHPSGQYDLLQVIETLGKTNQVLYSTHSLFMINKTFPTRHRLILKNSEGTVIEGKPYHGRWGSVISALGLSLTGTILFANYVLLTEGDSDPIYIQALLQKLVAIERTSVDLNSFSAISTGQVRNADSLIRLLMETAPKPHIALLLDGDQGGKERLADLKRLLDEHKIPCLMLQKGTAIEDHLPLVSNLYVDAVAMYIRKVVISRGGTTPDLDDMKKKFRESFEKKFNSGRVTEGVADWADDAAMEIGKLNNPPSKIGIAREYVGLLEETDASILKPKTTTRIKDLAKRIQENLNLPGPIEAAETIYEEAQPTPEG